MSPFITEFARRPSFIRCFCRAPLVWRLVPLVVLALSIASAAQAAPSKRDEALEHFARGNAAFEEGELEAALVEYRTAWSLHRAFDIACNLGRVEIDLEHFRDAAEHLAYCLENFSASTRPELLRAEQNFRELYERVRTQVGAFRLEVDPAGAHVSIDGRPAPRSSSSGLVFVEPGAHQVRAELSGYRTIERSVPVVAGQEREVAFKLEREGTAEPALPPASPPPTGDSGPPRDQTTSAAPGKTIAIIAGSTLAAAGLGVGIGMAVHRSNLQIEADDLQAEALDQFGRNGCRNNPAELCTELDETVDAEHRAGTLSTVGFVAAGVFAAGTLAAILLWPSDAGDQGAWRLHPSVGPGAAQLSITGVF